MKPGFRPDIEGLRAVCVLAVVIYHAFPTLLPGGFVGVDAFFVISGFLITKLLVVEWTATGRIDLLAFWSRRIRRILPVATLVLVVVAIAVPFVTALEARKAAPHLIAAATFVHNFHQMRDAVDYLGSSHLENPVLHYWSLSVEEQFYAVWPLLLIGFLALGARLPRLGPGRAAAIGLGALLVLSFTISVLMVETDPARAFFHPLSRGWQLLVGAAVAFLDGRTRPIELKAATVLAGLGGVGLAASFVWLSNETTYPGAFAALPTLSTAALIAATGMAPTPLGAALAIAPLRWIGRLSFSWYLWHWPVLVLGRLVLPVETEMSGVARDLGLIGFSLAVSVASYRFVEAPARHAQLFTVPRWRPFALAAAMISLTIGIGIVLRHVAFDHVPIGGGIWMSSGTIKRDRPVVYDDGCLLKQADVIQPPCLYGATSSARTVVLLGDSHGGNWFSPLADAARAEGWRLMSRLKAACRPIDTPQTVSEAGRSREYTECNNWLSATLAEIERNRPALIIVGATRHNLPVEREQRTLERLAAVAPIVVLRGTPWLKEDALACLRRARGSDRCVWQLRDLVVKTNFPRTPPTSLPAGARILDLNDLVCPDGLCRVVSDGQVVFFDQHHLTASFSRRATSQFRTLLTSYGEASR
jgi:peptidoglycan/LPS O-acetylase OafA/YrhL